MCDQCGPGEAESIEEQLKAFRALREVAARRAAEARARAEAAAASASSAPAPGTGGAADA